MTDNSASSSSLARPFLKWAGGKGQLLAQLDPLFPPQLKRGEIRRYVEPFIGSGAVFFHVLQAYSVEMCQISDLNPELILAYRVVQADVEGLIEALARIETHYLRLAEEERRSYYYNMRERFNRQRVEIEFERLSLPVPSGTGRWRSRPYFSPAWIERTAMLVFLNRTGYNGLFRLNSRGDFNVPFGRYPTPRLLDADNLRMVAHLLQGVKIQYGDFEAIEGWIDAGTLVYFDPPYRPISNTADFTSYSKDRFDDRQQLRLAEFYRRLDAKGAKLMLSNSDPSNTDPNDTFFELAYSGFRIERLRAKRNINRDGGKRGPISELLILNY